MRGVSVAATLGLAAAAYACSCCTLRLIKRWGGPCLASQVRQHTGDGGGRRVRGRGKTEAMAISQLERLSGGGLGLHHGPGPSFSPAQRMRKAAELSPEQRRRQAPSLTPHLLARTPPPLPAFHLSGCTSS
ncbi:hypothetical protein B0J12DRAFT_123189 [Macrophomina phaseolina]|uniref:Secreted protein n=1 Tax=Macrophomina phaseolina TaxID=35725 RepID=A0ABQ8GAQ5_9PEZI|nr:hypothetical protein B0J12DRAFT_123189 [Macrophomina phaseolina]